MDGAGGFVVMVAAGVVILGAITGAFFFGTILLDEVTDRVEGGAVSVKTAVGATLGIAACALILSCFVDLLHVVATGSTHMVEDVVESYPIRSFEPEQAGLHIEGSATDVLICSSFSLDAERVERYVVMADLKDDGGLTRRTFAPSKVAVYEDAAPGEAWVEVVEIWQVLDEKPFGLTIRWEFPDVETRIHVPAGTLVYEAPE